MIFNWFTKNRSVTIGNFLMGITDIHTHLLPAVDDGATSRADTQVILQEMLEAGVRRAFCTPHIMADFSRNDSAYLQEQFTALLQPPASAPLSTPSSTERSPSGNTNVPGKGIDLRLAAEYMLDHVFASHLDSGLLTYDGKHVLLETSYLSAPPAFESILYEVALSGYYPILAHPERYLYMAPERYAILKNNGCLFQLNLFSLCGYYGKDTQQRSKWLLKKGYYDFAGTDTHRPGQLSRLLHHKINVANHLLEKLIRQNDMLWNSL